VTNGRTAGAGGRYPGPMPADLASAYAVLDSLTGSRSATMAMLGDTRWPGATLAAPELVPTAMSMRMAQAGAGPIRIAQAGAAAIEIAPPAGTTITIGDVTVERLAGGALRIGGIALTAAMLLAAFDSARERAEVLGVLTRFGLDQGQAADVLAARAYVWAHWFGPIAFPNMPWAGPVHERTCEAIMRYERERPGTAGLASRGNLAAIAAISQIVDEMTAGALDENPAILERRSTVDPALSTSSSKARTILGNPGLQSWQAHHLIPFAVMASQLVPFQQKVVAAGWVMDSAENLIALPANYATFIAPPNSRILPQHSGSHMVYDADVRAALVPVVFGSINMKPAELRTALGGVETEMRRRLIARRYHPRVF
jgi:hypothetical protein